MAVEVKIPVVGESVKEVTIAVLKKKSGDYVQMDEAICEIESSKANLEIAAPTAGIITFKVEEGQNVPIGFVMGTIEPSAAPTTVMTNVTSIDKAIDKALDKAVVNHPSPSAKKILDENQINLQDIKGSGKDGRVTKADALTAIANAKVATPTIVSKASAAPANNVNVSERSMRRERMSGLRKTIAKRLVEAKNTTAMLTTFNEVDMSNVMELRKKYKDSFKEKHQINLGFMSFFTKACCLALKEVPAINSVIDENELVYHDYCDMGVAVSTPRGLVVPVIRNAEKLDLAGIEKAIAELAGKAKDNKLSLDEMQGGTFTITNGGIFGSMLSTPIINIPQSAILGMHNIVERPVAVNGQVVIRPIMFVALSYDHRNIDGRESVTFLKRVKEYIEDPTRLLLQV